ncbi:hypothetical protein IFM89_010158 [Coptis chinensis]|uniref:Pentatricopeptide repeat-containing protein n=1 Tax=Coptis chinensis TaxID=261450 RepID=A0A835IA80_9MAGN|nr:hypothetical protein IFM89_010158 [Coptis chinensis]
MIFYGAFSDSKTYSNLLKLMLKLRKVQEVSVIFNEMVKKNEFIPTHENCSAALALYVDVGDPDMVIKVWKCMLENEMTPGWEIARNKLIVGLRDLNRLNRLPARTQKSAKDMIEKGMKLHSKTLSKLKQSLTQLGKAYAYDELLRKWKSNAHYPN